MSDVHVIEPGMLTTIQDLGRWGFQAWGVPVAGPMDSRSHRFANALVGNPQAAATLEVTIVGPELEFSDRRSIAVTGAEFEMAIDGRVVAPNVTFRATAGSRLRFGRRVRGARAYIAVSGGVSVSPILGSRATHVASAMGGQNGRRLQAGDRLPLGDGMPLRETSSVVHASFSSSLPDGHARVRVLPGAQHDDFSDEAVQVLQAAPYRIAGESNRMGFRLEGEPLVPRRGADIISDATPMGALQVPGSGLPILLMADRQTTGGYPKIAAVISADLSLAGQLVPGDTISFVMCSPREALAALIAQERALAAVEHPEAR